MKILLAITAILSPRMTLFFIWLLTRPCWFDEAFETQIWPFLGWWFAPYTTLVYMGAMLNDGALVDGWLLLCIVSATYETLKFVVNGYDTFKTTFESR